MQHFKQNVQQYLEGTILNFFDLGLIQNANLVIKKELCTKTKKQNELNELMFQFRETVVSQQK